MVPLGPTPGHQTSINNSSSAPSSGTKGSSTVVSCFPKFRTKAIKKLLIKESLRFH